MKKEIVLKAFSDDMFQYASYADSSWKSANADSLSLGVVIDLETSGTYAHIDQVIEIGMILFSFNPKDGALIEIVEEYSSLNELIPGTGSLSLFVKQLTELTEEKLKGHKIDWDKVNLLLKKADIVIAHNARFDRSFMDKESLISQSRLWGCSMSQVDWMKHGFKTKSLELLSQRFGFFSDSHRALIDAKSTLHIITHFKQNKSETYLRELLKNTKIQRVLLEATNSPFESKDLLRERRYRWSTKKRVWSKTVLAGSLESEKKWLLENIYTGAREDLSTSFEIPIIDNFKS
jgi:DNA polymerase III subunit epsilon